MNIEEVKVREEDQDGGKVKVGKEGQDRDKVKAGEEDVAREKEEAKVGEDIENLIETMSLMVNLIEKNKNKKRKNIITQDKIL